MARTVRFAALCWAGAGWAGAGWAQEPGAPQRPSGIPTGDPQALSVGVPVRIQDALTTPQGETILQVISTTTYAGRKGYGVTSPVSETIKYGAAPGFGVNLGIANELGDIGTTNHAGTTVSPSFQYVLTNSHGDIPGISVEGFYTPPPATGLSGGFWGFSGQVTKFLGPTDRSPRLHFNVEFLKFNDQTRHARPEAINYGVGLSSLLTDRLSLVGDVFYSQTGVRRESQTFLDLGSIYLLSPRLAVSAGVGAGLERSTPAGRLFVSFSLSF